MAEIYTLGSQPLIERILSLLNETGIRTANKGEFTFRAFLNGRIDLVQAEAVLGVIDSRDETELQTALDQLGGGLSHRLSGLRNDLLELLADLEAGLDFVDEDIEFVPHENVVKRLANARSAVEEFVQYSQTRLRSESRMRVVLAGLPNVGKSTLLNQLSGENTALVSDISGTTRDYLAAECQLEGQPVLMIDTAGWEHNGNPIMQSAQTFREEQIRQADLVIWCSPHGLTETEATLDLSQADLCKQQSHQFLLIKTKADLATADGNQHSVIHISLVDSQPTGLEKLRTRIAAELSQNGIHEGGLIGSTSARCQQTLRDTLAALTQAYDAATLLAGDELIALELRSALEGLGQVLGLIHTDDLLDRIFSKFCIGK